MSEPFGTTSTVSDVESPVVSSAFVPLLIMGLVMLMWFAFQATQFRKEQTAMRDAVVAQEKPLEESKKLRESLEALMRGTNQLADGGNANARLIMDELKKRGVTYTPTSPTSPTSSTDAAPATK